MSDVIIIGAGGHAKVVADAVIKSGDRLLGFLDDFKEGAVIDRYEVIGKVADAVLFADTARFVIGIGGNEIRRRIATELDGKVKWKTVIHPMSNVGIGVSVGCGTVIFAGASANPGAVIGKHCIINTGASAEHDSVMGDYSHISVGSALCGEAKLGELSFLGACASVKQTVSVCEKVTIGCGGAVVKDITE
jgi:sugar O-acyltransferase (sialic acid O-acetyltransferase NeuD family)